MGLTPARSAAAAAAALLLAGCAAPAHPALPEDVAVEIVQQRSDVADRAVQVRVVNESGTDLVVQRVELVDARFADPPPRERVSPVPAGRAVDLRIRLPAAVCDETRADAAAPRVRLELAGVGVVTVPAADVLDVLGPLHARECLAERVAAVAVLDVAGIDPAPPGEPAILSIGVRPAGGAGVLELVELRETNLLRMPAATGTAHALGVEVRGDGPPIALAVPLLPTRCDPHAVQEDKRGTVFRLIVRLDGVEGAIELAAPAPVRAEVLDWVADWCGFGR